MQAKWYGMVWYGMGMAWHGIHMDGDVCMCVCVWMDGHEKKSSYNK